MMLCQVPLTRTPYQGSVYEASVLYCACQGVSWWHCSLDVHVPEPPGAPVTPFALSLTVVWMPG